MRTRGTMVFCWLLALTLGGTASAGDFSVRVSRDANPWTHLDAGPDRGDFTFAIVPDRTGGNRPGPFREAMRRLNAMGPDFVVSVGDLIEGYTEDEDEIRTQWDELDSIVNGLRMPFFYVPGNHDIANAAMKEAWGARYGRNYYHFKHKGVLFLMMDTQDPPGGGPRFSEAQVAYFRKAIAKNLDVRWTFVLFHQPTWVQGENPLAEIEEALDGRPYTVFAGHYHAYSYAERKGRQYIVCATAGGGSSVAGPLWGAFDHVVWVRFDENGPDITNVLLKGLYGPDVVMEEAKRLEAKLATTKGPLSLSPVIVGAEGLTAATVTIEAENETAAPALLVGRFADNPGVTADPAELEIALPPKSRKRLDIQLAPAAGNGGELPAPLMYEGTITYYLPNGDEPAFEVAQSIPFVRAYPGQRWDFDGGLEGWGEANQADLTVKDGALQILSTGTDPYMRLDLEDAGPVGPLELRLRLRAHTMDPVQIFWATKENPVDAQERSSGADIEHDGAWHEYAIPFYSDTPITGLRVDSGGAEGLIEYDFIELVQGR